MQLPLSEREEQLRIHRHLLVERQHQLTQVIETLDAALQINQQGKNIMPDEEKFAAFKQTQITQNSRKFGTEVVQRWGEDVVRDANQQYLSLSQHDMAEAKAVETKLIAKLIVVIDSKDENSEAARKVVVLHKKWLSYFWKEYSVSAHKGLGRLYVFDNCFIDYYQNITKREEAAATLNSLIQRYA